MVRVHFFDLSEPYGKRSDRAMAVCIGYWFVDVRGDIVSASSVQVYG